jgi:hypothetical protein
MGKNAELRKAMKYPSEKIFVVHACWLCTILID